MPFELAETWTQRSLQMQVVKDKCNEIINLLELPETDARSQGFIHVRQLCNTIALVGIKIMQQAEHKDNHAYIMHILRLQNEEGLLSFLNDLSPNSKASFITMVQFSFENCVEQTLCNIDGVGAQGGFSKGVRKILEVSGVEEPDRKHEIISVPSLIRNSLHLGGVHSRNDKIIELGGEPYVFKRGGRVECASWSHVMYCIYSALKVYQEIFLSESIRAIPHVPVVD
ncbi:hypothetical protein SAMN04488540_11297 [Ferrimonas sediminum]|uniref:Uncharacterized protein n=1 Tax=Ferrimonas sediminum TaxID=718193 RepID=A0A1G8W5E7_9GAMM|nr:hypothetical protein [Ferrimonas sediminum]SDJ73323.1 hypothetical protein SAMN04488540_11297 [Ferrimonas sediminum]